MLCKEMIGRKVATNKQWRSMGHTGLGRAQELLHITGSLCKGTEKTLTLLRKGVQALLNGN